MNIQIINLSNNNKIKELGKNLSIPSALYYKNNNKNNNKNLNILDKFICNNDKCCIDTNLYKNLLDKIKLSKKENKIYTKKFNRKNLKRNKSRKK